MHIYYGQSMCESGTKTKTTTENEAEALRTNISIIIKKYKSCKISSSGNRTLEQQIKFVKERPSQYPATLSAFLADHNLSRPKSLNGIYDGNEDWLRKKIVELANSKKGFQHLSGMAIDISLRSSSLSDKIKLANELEVAGYHVIYEKVNGEFSVYGVAIKEANVFHVDTL